MIKIEEMRILLLHTDGITQNDYLIRAIYDALSRSGCAKVVQARHSDAIQIFRKEQCNTFFAFGGAGKHNAILERLCKLSHYSILWTTEDPYELKENIQGSLCFNNIFTNDLASLPMYKGRAYHLPLAAQINSDLINTNIQDSDYLYDVSFLGTAWPNRISTINAILKAFPKSLKVKIGLPDNEFLPKPVLVDPEVIFDWRCSIHDFYILANKSRITLTLERKFSLSSDSQSQGSSPPPRLFEVAASGGFQIYLTQSNEVSNYFNVSQELKVCRTESDVVEAVQWALENPIERMAMAMSAQKRVISSHTYDQRISEIFSKLRNDIELLKVSNDINTRKHVLMVTHNITGNRPGGGIEIYQDNLKQINVKISYLFPIEINGSWFYRFVNNNRTLDYPLLNRLSKNSISNSNWELVFNQILFENSIDLVHYQHLLGHPLSLPHISRSCGIPSIYTYHDHYLICENYTLINYQGKFCDTAGQAVTRCDVCLSASMNLPNNSQIRRRNFISNLIEKIDIIVFNTEGARSYLRTVYPNLAHIRTRVIEMMLPNFNETKYNIEPTLLEINKKLQIAILGNFSEYKGADNLIRVFNMMRNEPIIFTILGRVDTPFSDSIISLGLDNVVVVGGYKQEDLSRLLIGSDLSIHASIWPETYLISLSEAWASGVVPIVTDIGAAGERVTHGVDGFKVAVNEPGDIITLLREIYSNPELLLSIKKEIMKKEIITSNQHCQELSHLYENLFVNNPVYHNPKIGESTKSYNFSLFDADHTTNSETWSSDEVKFDDLLFHLPIEKLSLAMRGLPSNYGHLPFKSITKSDKLADHHIDDFKVNGINLNSNNIFVSSSDIINVSGWAFYSNFGAPLEIYLCVANPSQEVMFHMNRSDRTDVANFLKKADAKESGFSVSISAEDIPQGKCSIKIIQVYDGKVISFLSNYSVTYSNLLITEKTSEGTVSFFDSYNHIDDNRKVVWADLDVLINKIDDLVVQVDQTLIFEIGQSIQISGFAANQKTFEVASDIRVILESDNSCIAVFPAERCRSNDIQTIRDPAFSFGGFIAKISTDKLWPGNYSISILQYSDDIYITKTHISISLISGFINVFTNNISLGLKKIPTNILISDSVRSSIEIDSIFVDEKRCLDMSSIIKGSHFIFDGWCSHKADITDRHIVIRLRQGDVEMFKNTISVARHDVADHLGINRSLFFGFKTTIDFGEISSGKYTVDILSITDKSIYVFPKVCDIELRNDHINS